MLRTFCVRSWHSEPASEWIMYHVRWHITTETIYGTKLNVVSCCACIRPNTLRWYSIHNDRASSFRDCVARASVHVPIAICRRIRNRQFDYGCVVRPMAAKALRTFLTSISKNNRFRLDPKNKFRREFVMRRHRVGRECMLSKRGFVFSQQNMRT